MSMSPTIALAAATSRRNCNYTSAAFYSNKHSIVFIRQCTATTTRNINRRDRVDPLHTTSRIIAINKNNVVSTIGSSIRTPPKTASRQFVSMASIKHQCLPECYYPYSIRIKTMTKYIQAQQQKQQQQTQQRYYWSKPAATTTTAVRTKFSFLPHLNIVVPKGGFYDWFFAKVPKGFEDFFPNDDVDKNVNENNNKTEKQQQNNKNDDLSSTENKKENPDPIDDNHDPTTTTTTAKNASNDENNTDRMNASSSSSSSPPPNNHNQKNDNQKKKKSKKQGSNRAYDLPPLSGYEMPILIGLFLLWRLVSLFLGDNSETDISNAQEITYTEFWNQLLLPGLVERIVVINNKTAIVILKSNTDGSSGRTFSNIANDVGDINPTMGGSLFGGRTKKYYFHIGSVESFEEKLTRTQVTSSIRPEQWVDVEYVNRTQIATEFVKFLPSIVSVTLMFLLTRHAIAASGMGGGGAGPGGIFSVGKSTAKKIKKEDVNVTFADVAGCDEAKKEIMEFVDFLKDSSRFTKLGAKIPKGALLCGPPGTGKTLLAKATAGEAGVPFYSISGSDFIEMFVGVGPSRVRDLFKEARENAPCIIFIDEIDAVGKQRGGGGFRGGGNDERENTLNQLLVEMDGFSATTGIVVLAGTNRVDILDQALTRPGRFDRQVQVDRPDLKGRREIFNVHLKGIKLEGPVEDYAGRLAGLTPGFVGADIANICNEAAIVAARRKAESVSVADFEKATDRIIGGLESNKIMSEHERRIVAHHEAGHAMAGWFLEHADPILKVTIIPRTSGALGFAQYLPKEVFLRSQEQIMDIVCMASAGRAAEEVFFGDVTTGASDDLKRVTQLVYSTIKDFGMNSKVGQLSFPNDGETLGDKPYSDSTAESMDDEARKIVDAAYLRTVELIRKHKDETEKVANLLLKQETITHDDILDLVGPRPFTTNSTYQEYVTNRRTYDKPKEEKKEDEEESETNMPDGLTPGLAFSQKI